MQQETFTGMRGRVVGWRRRLPDVQSSGGSIVRLAPAFALLALTSCLVGIAQAPGGGLCASIATVAWGIAAAGWTSAFFMARRRAPAR